MQLATTVTRYFTYKRLAQPVSHYQMHWWLVLTVLKKWWL